MVAVFGGGDAGITEALYMTKIASRVILLEVLPELTATAVLQERATTNPKLEIRCGVKGEAIIGDNHVEALEFLDTANSQKETLKVDGVLVHIGLDPCTEYLDGIVPLDSQGQIIVNDRMETEVPFLLAAGDIRSGSPGQIVTAVVDQRHLAVGVVESPAGVDVGIGHEAALSMPTHQKHLERDAVLRAHQHDCRCGLRRTVLGLFRL